MVFYWYNGEEKKKTKKKQNTNKYMVQLYIKAAVRNFSGVKNYPKVHNHSVFKTISLLWPDSQW